MCILPPFSTSNIHTIEHRRQHNSCNGIRRKERGTEKWRWCNRESRNFRRKSRILVLGGTGRVGGSTAVAFSKFCPDLRIVIGGRNREKGAAMVSKLRKGSEFSEVDINDSKSLDTALKDVDLVVHTAGPFQQAQNCAVLEAAVRNKTAYLDVCDDTSYAWLAKTYMKKAVDANIPAIIAGKNIPRIMAAELVCASKFETKGSTTTWLAPGVLADCTSY